MNSTETRAGIETEKEHGQEADGLRTSNQSMAGTQMQVQENDAGDKDQQKKSRQKPPVMKCEAADRRHAT
jgi:hypothetical protein